MSSRCVTSQRCDSRPELVIGSEHFCVDPERSHGHEACPRMVSMRRKDLLVLFMLIVCRPLAVDAQSSGLRGKAAPGGQGSARGETASAGQAITELNDAGWKALRT